MEQLLLYDYTSSKFVINLLNFFSGIAKKGRGISSLILQPSKMTKKRRKLNDGSFQV